MALKGQIKADLGAGENRRLDFILLTPSSEDLTVEFLLTDEEGEILAIAEAYIEQQEKE